MGRGRKLAYCILLSKQKVRNFVLYLNRGATVLWNVPKLMAEICTVEKLWPDLVAAHHVCCSKNRIKDNI
jgi:hypothetical protein